MQVQGIGVGRGQRNITDKMTVGGARPDGQRPWFAVRYGIGPRSGIAGRRRNQDPAVIGIQESVRYGITIRVAAAADREIDDIDAVMDSLLNRRRAVGIETAL